MENKFKRFLSLLLALVMVIGMLPAGIVRAEAAEGDTTVYLKPDSSIWATDGAWFAAYYWISSDDNGWVRMTDDDGDGIYTGTIPAGYSNIIFTRNDPAQTDLCWESSWNQTNDQTITGTNNLYTITGWDNRRGVGNWSHQHINTTVTKAATCGADGSVVTTCTVCGEETTETLTATGNHSYVDGSCSVCGAADPEAPVTISGTVNGCFIMNPDGGSYITTAIKNVYAENSIVLKLTDAEGTLLATSTLVDNERVLLGKTCDEISGTILIAAQDEWWNTTWEEGKLRADHVPATITLVVDGNEMNSTPALIRNNVEIAINWADVAGVNPAPSEEEDTTAYVAQIGEDKYETLAEALAEATDNATIELISGENVISMAGAVYGKTVTITGTAVADWNQGYLFVGRGGEGNGKLIFDNATITSASNSSSYGIHVSGREKENTNKYDGTLEIKNSNIELDYLIDRGTIVVDNSTLTVKNGFGIAGRPASETESGENATATITIQNGCTVTVKNHNGMGVGTASATPEGYGVLNLVDSIFECDGFNVTNGLGKFNVSGTSVINLNGKTFTGSILAPEANLTVKNGTIVNTDKSVSALEINAGTLTLTDVNINSARHAVRIDGAVIATINGGTYKAAIGEGTGTYHAVNVSGAATVTIKDGTFVGPKGTTADSGSAVNVQSGAAVTIEGGDFSGGKNNTLAADGNLTVTGGTFDQDPSAYVASGYEATETDGTYTVAEAAVRATTSPAYTKEVDGYVRVWGEGGGNASESFVLKLYSGETLIATTQLNNVGGIIDGDVYVTWNFFYPESNDEYWTTTWEEGHPNSAAQPTKVQLWIDDTMVVETDAKMSGADDLNPVVWAELGGVKKIVTGLSGSGTEEDPYLINNLEELLWFQAKVDEQASDGSTQFAGKYFKLTADIDLAGIEWNPIGSMSGDHGSFQGVFDGDNHTISNLNVQTTGNGLGLFARTAGNAEIKNLTLNNVTVKSTDNSNYVGGVVGNAYASTKISNVHVTGTIDISGRGYIGGIAGHGYVVMDNVSVKGEGTISSTFWCAGGILGYGGEGTTNITNATVEGTGNGLTITSAAGGLGAIVGMAEDNNGTQPISGSNLSAKNVDIKTYTGVYGDAYANYALGYLYGGNPTSKLTGTLSVEDVKVETSNGEEPEINDAVATIGDAVYFNLQSAVDAAQDSDTVTLLRDVANVGVITIDKSVTIDLDGKTVNLQQLKIASNITVEVKNGSLVGTSADYDTIRSEAGNLTLTDVNVSGLRHTVRIKSGTATINGGTYTYGGTEVVYKTLNIINVGDDEDPENTKANVTIKAGTFVGPKGYAYDGGCAVKVQAGSTVTIEGGSFSKGVQSVVHADDTATLSITGGTFDQDPSAYVAEGYEATETDGTYTVAEAAVRATTWEVATKEELDAAIADAVEGDTILLTADIDYGANILKIEKAITLDLGGYELTTSNGYGGMWLKNGSSIKNGTYNHNGNTAAIKVWNAVSIEDLVINVGFTTEGKVKGGIVIQENSVGVQTIKNVTIQGEGLTNGIETYNCGNATEPVIGSMENVTINAVGTGMLISAPCGTATDCSISGGINGIEIWIKGTYSASLYLVDCDVTGGEQAVYAHDEFKEGVVNNGTLSLTADSDTGLTTDDVTLALVRDNESVEGLLKEAKEAGVAKVGYTYYGTLADAAAAIATDGTDTTIKILSDIEVAESIKFAYGTGNVTFTADKPVTIKQTATSDFSFTQNPGVNNKIIVGENVTFELYDNSSDFTAYYGPSLELNGTITGGANWGALYLFQGSHTVSETGKIGMGRVQLGYTSLTVNGEVVTNYLLVENSTFTADGATVNANVIYDNNNGGQRWGASTFNIKNGATVTTTKLDLSYADTVLNIDLSSSLTATTVTGAGKIVVDATGFDGTEVTVITGDLSTFTGSVELTNAPEGATLERTDNSITVKAAEETLTGSIKLYSAALNLQDKVCIIYKAVEGSIETKDEDVAERGVLLYDSAEKAATKDPSQANETVQLVWNATEERYVGQSEGIDARDMDKSQFAVAYLKMTDGTYIFGAKDNGEDQVIEYSPLIYCKNKKTDTTVGTLCNALMQYGAAAQVAQHLMTTGLMNEAFDEVPYDETVLGNSVFSVNTTVVNGMQLKSATMDLKGAISYIVKFTVEESISNKRLYAEYTLMGETGSVELVTGEDGKLWATIAGVAPKDLDETLTVKAYYLNDNGEKVYGGELVYSGYEYIRRAQTSTTMSDADKALSRALAMYIYYADAYANSH